MLAMPPIISVSNLSKTYGTGFKALNNINLDIKPGEIFAPSALKASHVSGVNKSK